MRRSAEDAKPLSERDNHETTRTRIAPSVLTSWARSIVAALDARGLDGTALAERAGIAPAALADPGCRAPVAATGRLWRLAVEVTDDPCFGLFASRYLTFPTFQALGVAVLASASMRDAFGRLARYSRIVSDAADYGLEPEGDRCRLVIDIHPEADLAPEAVDAIAALKVRTVRALHGDRSLGPVAVALRRSRPNPSEPFARFFRAPVEFGASLNVITFSSELLDRALPGAQAELAEHSDALMNRLLAERDVADVGGRVRSGIRDRLPAGEPSQQDVARAMGMSPRTLQRRLADNGTTFAALVADVRADLAKSHLRDGHWSITEIAFSLGFADVSSFSRAFRKWTGRSPTEWRG